MPRRDPELNGTDEPKPEPPQPWAVPAGLAFLAVLLSMIYAFLSAYSPLPDGPVPADQARPHSAYQIQDIPR